jgi:hypothetical protein
MDDTHAVQHPSVIVKTSQTFIFIDKRNNKVRHVWLSIVGALTVGVSLGLPLYLYLRETSGPE